MLNFSSFMHLAYEHRNISSYELGDFMYYFFIEILSNQPSNISDKSYLSNIYNGSRNLTKDLIDEIGSTKSNRNRCFNGIKNWLLPNISLVLLDSFKDKLSNLIDNDNNIPPSSKNKFKESLEKDEYPKYLTKVFLFAIKQNNIALKDKPDKEDIEFVLEVNKKCPLCNTSLTINKSKKMLYKYSIVNIYPSNISVEDEELYNVIKRKPIDTNSKYNKICLCHTCADNYVFSPSPTIYDKLVIKKKSLIIQNSINERISAHSLDQEIGVVLVELKNIKETPVIKELRKKPLEIKEKIKDNDLLRDKIIQDVNKYYHFVRHTLSQIDGNNTEFRIIANSIQNCYLELTKDNLEQEEIYYRIIDWILEKMELSSNYRTACQIVVSFFVQNCEVFDEITK